MGLDDTWPVIYLRGYAGDQKGVEQTVDDPFYGFNAGSTHVRVGPTGSATFYAFEGSVIRLMTDHQYQDAYDDGVQAVGDIQDPLQRQRTVWIHRYYDDTSATFDRDTDPQRWSIERAAADLADLIDEVRTVTDAPMVYLVGHSTGGLIIRSLLQRHYPESRRVGRAIVAKVFTYGTPHGGIHFGNPAGPSLEWLRDRFGWNNVADFGRQRMYEYLTPGAGPGDTPPKDFEPRYLPPEAFPPERFFCLIGTDADDYGLPRKVVGPQSDGLVQIGSAYVHSAPRAYVHRAHSGRYGIVNSEAGYANLERFFFGSVRVRLSLERLDAIREHLEADVSHQADVTVSLRGLPVVLHEQTRDHFCPIPLEWKEGHEGEPITLFSLFLIPERAVDDRMRYAVSLAVYRIERRNSGLWHREHLEKIPLWADSLVVDLMPEQRHALDARYDWRGEMADPAQPPDRPLDPHDDGDGTVTARIPLPEPARAVLGRDATLLVDAGWWHPYEP